MKRSWILVLTIAALFFVFSCDDDDNGNGTGPTPTKDDLVGSWLSAGENVAPLLVTLMGIDSIWANFEEDKTYEVIAKDTLGTIITFIGTYANEKSNVDDIYTITLNQSSPTTVTSEGIYQIDKTKTPHEMTYEVAQTEPDIGATPPTPEAGFGSTSGGLLGTLNVQKFIRLE